MAALDNQSKAVVFLLLRRHIIFRFTVNLNYLQCVLVEGRVDSMTPFMQTGRKYYLDRVTKW